MEVRNSRINTYWAKTVWKQSIMPIVIRVLLTLVLATTGFQNTISVKIKTAWKIMVWISLLEVKLLNHKRIKGQISKWQKGRPWVPWIILVKWRTWLKSRLQTATKLANKPLIHESEKTLSQINLWWTTIQRSKTRLKPKTHTEPRPARLATTK